LSVCTFTTLDAKFLSDVLKLTAVALWERSEGRSEKSSGVPEVKEPKEDWVSSLRELEVIRDAMVHVTRNLLMGVIDGTVYIDLMTKYYEGIRRILLKALEGNYPNEFFHSYTETFSEPAVTRLVAFLMMSYERAKLTPKEARWCSLVLQGNIADAGPPPTPSAAEGAAVPSGVAETQAPPTSASPRGAPPVKAEGSATASATTTEGTKEEEKTPQVVDEFTEFFNQLVAERDRLREKERPIIYIALLAIAYARGKVGRDALVQLGNEYLERAKGSDPKWISEQARRVMRELASRLKRRGDVPALIIKLLEKPKIVRSNRDLRIEG
jgi:hypothetical protein